MSNSDAIDWHAIPELQADIQRLKDYRDGVIENPADLGNWFREPEKEYLLRVKVTDVDLAQAVLTRAFSNDSRIPGMDVTEIVLHPNVNLNQTIATRLRELADKVESEE